MWSVFGSSSKAAAVVVRSIPADVAEALRTEGATTQNLNDLAALSFSNTNEMRHFVQSVASHLTSSEVFHQVTAYLVRARLVENGRNVKDLLTVDALARTFLAYQFVHHKEWAVEHIKSEGAIYSALGWGQLAVMTTGTMSMPISMPEVAFFLGLDGLRSDRTGTDEQSVYLNAIDRFIIKYFIAELDETRKEQVERRVNDERGGYRGGRKVSVGLAVRDAIVKNNFSSIPDVFKQALSENGISYDAFFEGGTKKHLSGPLFGVLEAARPSSPVLR